MYAKCPPKTNRRVRTAAAAKVKWSDTLLHRRRHHSKLHAWQSCPSHIVPKIDLSTHTSFRQASPDTLCCVHPHVFLDPSSFNTVYSELWMSGFSVSSGCCWNHSRFSQPVNLNRCSRPLVSLNRCSRPVVSVAPQSRCLKSHSFATLNANLERPPALWQPAVLPLCGNLPFSSISASPSEPVFSNSGTFAMVSTGHRLMHPQDLGMEVSQSSRSEHRRRRRGVHSYTLLDHLGDISSHGNCVNSSRSTLGQSVILGWF